MQRLACTPSRSKPARLTAMIEWTVIDARHLARWCTRCEALSGRVYESYQGDGSSAYV